jgi:hypothetical protein
MLCFHNFTQQQKLNKQSYRFPLLIGLMESKSESKEESAACPVARECKSTVDQHLIKRRNNLLCCVDGSTFGDYTLQTAFNLSKKHDHVTVFHAFKGSDEESKIFPISYRPAEMKMKYECEMIGHLPSDRYSFWWISRDETKDRKAVDELHEALRVRRRDDDYPDFILMGHVGRKGRKDTVTTLGSNSDVSLRTLHVPIIIVKQPCPATKKTFMLSINTSHYSERGLDVILNLISPRDKLILFHFFVADSEDAIQSAHLLKKKYEEELEMYGPLDSSVELVEKEQGKSLSHCIADYVNEVNPTFLGICPRGKASISSISEYVVNNVQCSVVFCKT